MYHLNRRAAIRRKLPGFYDLLGQSHAPSQLAITCNMLDEVVQVSLTQSRINQRVENFIVHVLFAVSARVGKRGSIAVRGSFYKLRSPVINWLFGLDS